MRINSKPELVYDSSSTINFNNYVQQRKTVQMIPKGLNQEHYIDLLTDPSKYIVFATGPAGTGKTMLAMLAAIKAYKEGLVSKIILTRPAVGADDEKHGFLPGDINAKMEPWVIPLFDVLHEYYSPKETARMLDEKIIEVAPLAYQRGRTYKNAWVILDEAQGCSINLMKMVLTRLGAGSKMVITGDLQQTDRHFTNNNGLQDITSRISKSDSKVFGYVNFSIIDVQRSEACAAVLKLYGE